MRRAVLACCIAATAAACASGPPGRSTAGPTQAERIALLEERVQRLDNLSDAGQMVDLVQRVETLHAELRELRGEVERLAHDGDALGRRQRELYLDLDRRLQNMEAGRNVTAMPVGPLAVTPPLAPEAQTDGAPQRASADAAQRDYDAAYRLLLEGRYPVAIDAFRKFLDDHPGGPLAGNAQYWLGEAYFVTRDFANALTEFRKVVDAYPQSSKVPDALLKVGYTQYELQQWAAARDVLTELTRRAPDTTVARLAQRRLDRMRQEGR